MSVNNVKAFFEEVEGNKVLQEKLKALDRKAEDSVKEAIAELIKIAAFKSSPEVIQFGFVLISHT